MTNTQVDKDSRYTPASSVILELKQFSKLLELDPPISCAEIAHRMAWTKRETRWLLTKMGDKRP